MCATLPVRKSPVLFVCDARVELAVLFSPFFLSHLRDPRLPSALFTDFEQNEVELDEFVVEHLRNLDVSFDAAANKLYKQGVDVIPMW